MLTVAGIIVIAVVAFAMTYYVVAKKTDMAKPGAPREKWVNTAVFFALMLLGMLAREVYNSLVNQKPFNWTSLAIAGVVSPMIFGSIYASAGGLGLDVASVIIAFQNGFFWNSIFEGLGPKS